MKPRMKAFASLVTLSLLLGACGSIDEAPLSISDLRIDPGETPATAVEIEETQIPYTPAERPLELAEEHFARGEYGISERYYRQATELRPDNVSAWLGLAASYDQLRRFDLSVRAYNKAVALVGPSVTILNNMGYSLLLQGNLPEARRKLLAAYELEPGNPYVQANIELLEEGIQRARAHNPA